MKALSIRQPWASLIVGYLHKLHKWIPPKFRKDVENRDWKYAPKYRGDLLIHASKTFEVSAVRKAEEILRDMGCEIILPAHRNRYAYGIIGEVYFNDVVTDSDSPWFFGKYGFKFRQPQPIEPIEYKGSLGLFNAEISMNQINYIEPPKLGSYD